MWDDSRWMSQLSSSGYGAGHGYLDPARTTWRDGLEFPSWRAQILLLGILWGVHWDRSPWPRFTTSSTTTEAFISSTKTQPWRSIISTKTGLCRSQRSTTLAFCFLKDSSLQSISLPVSHWYPPEGKWEDSPSPVRKMEAQRESSLGCLLLHKSSVTKLRWQPPGSHSRALWISSFLYKARPGQQWRPWSRSTVKAQRLAQDWEDPRHRVMVHLMLPRLSKEREMGPSRSSQLPFWEWTSLPCPNCQARSWG